MSDRVINSSGDVFRPTETARGVDISSQRTDWIDTECLNFIRGCSSDLEDRPKALDLGAGFATHSINMATAGADVTLIDLDCAQAIKSINAAESGGAIPRGSIVPIAKDFRSVADQDIAGNIHVLYSQRALHYLPYEDALALLRKIVEKMSFDGKAFLSVAGFDTEYGKSHPHREEPVQKRFSLVTEDMRIKHGIHHPIVTYTADEFKELLACAGLDVERIEASDFGNIKAIAGKRHNGSPSPAL